jgi:hypothetical protein
VALCVFDLDGDIANLRHARERGESENKRQIPKMRSKPRSQGCLPGVDRLNVT